MASKIYKIKDKGIEVISEQEYFAKKDGDSYHYIFDASGMKKDLSIEKLRELNFPEEVYTNMKEPGEHIRFEYVDNVLYGEVAYFSFGIKKSNYSTIIIRDNTLFIVHEDNDIIMSRMIKSLPTLNEHQLKNLSPDFLLYLLIVEFLSSKGKLIIEIVEKIEKIAIDLDKNSKSISPSDFLEAKTQLSDFSRVVDKLVYTVNFPPSRQIIDMDSDFYKYFSDLSQTTTFLKSSINQVEDRLNSLHDHFELLLQEKSNRRLNLLTIMQSIFVPLTFIAGIYGMNFSNMPELEYENAYFVTLGVMGLISLVSLFFFFKQGWFK